MHAAVTSTAQRALRRRLADHTAIDTTIWVVVWSFPAGWSPGETLKRREDGWWLTGLVRVCIGGIGAGCYSKSRQIASTSCTTFYPSFRGLLFAVQLRAWCWLDEGQGYAIAAGVCKPDSSRWKFLVGSEVLLLLLCSSDSSLYLGFPGSPIIPRTQMSTSPSSELAICRQIPII